jgi:hypothetical protein
MLASSVLWVGMQLTQYTVMCAYCNLSPQVRYKVRAGLLIQGGVTLSVTDIYQLQVRNDMLVVQSSVDSVVYAHVSVYQHCSVLFLTVNVLSISSTKVCCYCACQFRHNYSINTRTLTLSACSQTAHATATATAELC